MKSAPAPAGPWPVVRIEHLWTIGALSLIGFIIGLVPTSPNDFWWHLKAGELISGGSIPSTNIFAWTQPADAPFVYQSWLGEWLFYLLYQLGGLGLPIFARNILGLASFGLVAYEARRRSGSWRLAAGAALLAAAMTLNNLTTRTQNWSWVPCALIALLLSAYADGRLPARRLWAIPALMLFWANAHGAFVVGLLLLLAYAAGETLRLLLRQPRALSRPQLRTLYLVAAAGAAATLLNPRGLGLYGYVGTLVGNETIQGLVTEWQPPDPRTIAGGAFALGLLALLACFGLGRRRPTITDVLLVCGLGWMALSSARHVVWFGIVAMPIAAQALAAPRSPLAAPARRAVFAPMNAVVALLLLLPVVVVQPWIKTALPLPEPYQALFAELPGAPQLFSSDTPVAAAEHLRSQPCPGHLFSELGYSSYFIWALPTPAQVFVDPRFELFPDQVWQDYITISQGRDLAALQARYQIACVALDKIYQPRLATAIASDPSWVRTFPNSGQESRSEVWRRR